MSDIGGKLLDRHAGFYLAHIRLGKNQLVDGMLSDGLNVIF